MIFDADENLHVLIDRNAFSTEVAVGRPDAMDRFLLKGNPRLSILESAI